MATILAKLVDLDQVSLHEFVNRQLRIGARLRAKLREPRVAGTFSAPGNRLEEATGPSIGPMLTVRQTYLDQNAWADLDGGSSLKARRIYGDGGAGVGSIFAANPAGLPISWCTSFRCIVAFVSLHFMRFIAKGVWGNG